MVDKAMYLPFIKKRHVFSINMSTINKIKDMSLVLTFIYNQ